MSETIELDTSDKRSLCDDTSVLLDNDTIEINSSSSSHDAMDALLYTMDMYDDSYYDMTDPIDECVEKLPISSSQQDTGGSPFVEDTNVHDRESIIEHSFVEISESFEENNNDSDDSEAPGCSNESVPLPDKSPIDVIIDEQTRHVLDLVSRIHRDSVFNARIMNLDTPVSELRLWDLIPEADRLEFPDDIFPPKKPEAVRNIFSPSVARSVKNSDNQASKIKRDPNEDLCTTGCKRSTSTPDMSLSVPMVNPGAIPKVPSTSHIAKIEMKIVCETTTIRTVPLEQLKSKPFKVNNLPIAASTPKNVVNPAATVSQGAIPKVGVEPRHHGKRARDKIHPADQLAGDVEFVTPASAASLHQAETLQSPDDNSTNSKQVPVNLVVKDCPGRKAFRRQRREYREKPETWSHSENDSLRAYRPQHKPMAQPRPMQSKQVVPPALAAVRQPQAQYNEPDLQPALVQFSQQDRHAIQPGPAQPPVFKLKSSQLSSTSSTGNAIVGQQQIQTRPAIAVQQQLEPRYAHSPRYIPAVQTDPAQLPQHRPAVQKAVKSKRLYQVPAELPQHGPAVQIAPAQLPQHGPAVQTDPAQLPQHRPAVQKAVKSKRLYQVPAELPQHGPAIQIPPAQLPQHGPAVQTDPAQLPQHRPAVLKAVKSKRLYQVPAELPQHGPAVQIAPAQLPQHGPAVQTDPAQLPQHRPAVQKAVKSKRLYQVPAELPQHGPAVQIAPAQLPQHGPAIHTAPTQLPQHGPAVQKAVKSKRLYQVPAELPQHGPAVQIAPAQLPQHGPAVHTAPAQLPQPGPAGQPAPGQRQVVTPNSSQTANAVQQHVQPIKKIVCMEIYYMLINIFPNVDRYYVRNLCPADWAPGNRDDQLATLVETILEAGDTVPRIVDDGFGGLEEAEAANRSPDEIYENLLGIFPDADPHYLREFAEKTFGVPDSLKQFVETNLKSRDYPTREQYLAKLKITEQQRQYTSGFNVKQYLSIIADPSKHFTNANRQCRYSTVGFEFLKSRFNKVKVNTISKAYEQHRYNITLTSDYLEGIGYDMKTSRSAAEMATEDVLLLQEIAYNKHKTEIRDYVSRAKKAEEDEFNTMKAQNLLLECQCCYDAECVPSKCCNCDNGHIFCNECVINGTNAILGDGDTHIKCFANCGSEFSLSFLQTILAPTTFSILLKKRQAAEVMEAGVEGLVSCPFCHFASIPPENDKIFKCLNPECTKESCRLCKEPSHVPLKCNEVTKSEKARLYIEEKMTAALARTCYNCQKSFFKEEGCNKITCVCGAKMCYLCDQPIKDYSHFRGQGSNDQSRCPLYSDTIRLDAVAVREVAEQARLAVMRENPNVIIDTQNLLPAIPRSQRGPHENVLNADELPLRARRVLNLPLM